jgi:general secretion pathway protein K
MTRRSLPRRARGAAILLALLIMTLVATLAAGMVWLQWRGIEVEAADRARGQAQWLLNAALDWGDLILRSQIRNGHVQDDLTQPWATPLAETKLSSFLSADGSHAASQDSGPDAYLSGQITDAQSKYNLYNLVADPRNEAVRFELLCAQLNVAQSSCAAVVSNFTMSWSGATEATSTQDNPQAVLMPQTLDDLAWYGLDAKTIQQLEPYVTLIPPAPGQQLQVTKINANTAAAPVLAVAASGVQALANNLVQQRQQNPFKSTRDIENALGGLTQDLGLLTFQSDYFEIYGQLRYEQHVIRERSLVWRQNAALVTVLHRVRLAPDAQ